MTSEIETLREYLDYDRNEGRLFWRKKPCSRIVVGREAGSKRADGYRGFQLNEVRYLTHRVIFALEHGYFPEEVDHIDGDPANNHISNLRQATRSQQNMNRATQANNTSGHKGVYRHKRGKEYWCARIKVEGKYKCLGYFHAFEDAVAAYRTGAERYHGQYRRAY